MRGIKVARSSGPPPPRMNFFPAAGSASFDLGGRSPPPEKSPVRSIRVNRAGGPRFRTACGSRFSRAGGLGAGGPDGSRVGQSQSAVRANYRWVSISRRILRLIVLSVRPGSDHQNPSACMARAATRNLSATASKSASRVVEAEDEAAGPDPAQRQPLGAQVVLQHPVVARRLGVAAPSRWSTGSPPAPAGPRSARRLLRRCGARVPARVEVRVQRARPPASRGAAGTRASPPSRKGAN